MTMDLMSLPSLEDHITCQICFEVYRDPRALTCLHTFCAQCVSQLQRGSTTVKCPVCATQSASHQHDFKTQMLIDDHTTMQEKQAEGFREKAFEEIITRIKQCEVCTSADPSSVCFSCNQAMCNSCTAVHGKLTATKNHPVQSIRELVQAEVEKRITELERERDDVVKGTEIMKQDIESQRRHLENIREEKLCKVDEYFNNVFEKIHNYRSEVKTRISELTNAHLRVLLKTEEKIAQNPRKIQDMIGMLSGKSAEEKVSDLVATVEYIDEQLNSGLQEMRSDLSGVNSSMAAPQIEVTTSDISPVLENLVQLKVTNSLSNLHINAYTETVSNFVDNTLHRMLLIGDQLWCTSYQQDSISVYNKDCMLIKTVHIPQLQDIISLTNTHNNHVIVACNNDLGLHRINENGEYKQAIKTQGSFSDVCSFEDRVYALEHAECCVLVFAYSEESSMWAEIEDRYELNHNVGEESDDWDRITVNSTGLYVSSVSNHCVYRYDSHNNHELLSTLGPDISPGSHVPTDPLQGPLIGKSDHDGNMVVLDHENHRVLLVQENGEVLGLPNLKKPQEVDLPGDMKFHKDIAIDCEGKCIWLTMAEPCMLVKFTRTE